MFLRLTWFPLAQDDGRSPWLKFAQGVLDGLYKSDTLLGMVEALVIKEDRMRKGKSLRNMRYTDTFNSFCNLLASTSTRAYETFRRHFGGRTMGSIRCDILIWHLLPDHQETSSQAASFSTWTLCQQYCASCRASREI